MNRAHPLLVLVRVLVPIFAMILVGASGLAHAGPGDECLAAQVLHEIEPSERDQIEGMCRGRPSASAPPIDIVTKLGGWRATVAARAAAKSATPPVALEQARTALTSALAGSKCADLRSILDSAIDDYARERDPSRISPVPPSLVQNTGKKSNSGCLSADIVKAYSLFTYVGQGDVEAWIIDESSGKKQIYASEPVAYFNDAKLVLVPRGQTLVASVRQQGLDVPWVIHERLRSDMVVPARKSECLIVEFTTANASDPWWLVVDGQPLATEPKEIRRLVLEVPAGAAHELVFHVAGSTPWTSALSTQTRKRGECQVATFDFRSIGASTSDQRYGIAEVAVDQQCKDLGIIPAAIRRYLDAQSARQTGVQLVQLDVWADIMESFRSLEKRLGSDPSKAAGASAGETDDREEMAVIAEELMRQGVTALLYLDVHCADEEAVVTGRKVNLDALGSQPKSSLLGLDTGKLIKVRSHTVSTERLRDALDLVFGVLVGGGSLRFVDPPHEVVQGRRQQLRLFAELEPGVRRPLHLQVYPAQTGVCELIEQTQTLARFDDHSEAFGELGSAVISKSSKDLGQAEPKNELSVAVGGLRGGRYLALGFLGPGAEPSDSSLVAAVCFEVHEHDFEIVVGLAGLAGWRGYGPAAFTPRADRYGYARLGIGVRYTAKRIFEVGGGLGYEFADYRTDVVPSWDGLDGSVATESSGRTSLAWQRHGLLVNVFTGLNLPFDHCAYRQVSAIPVRDCAVSKWSAFVDFSITGNLGFTDLRGIPASILALPTHHSTLFAPDLDLAGRAGLRWRPRELVRVGVYFGTLFADILGFGQAAAGSFNNDAALRWILGVEMAWGMATR